MYEIFSYGNFLSQLKLYFRSIFFQNGHHNRLILPQKQSFLLNLSSIHLTLLQKQSFYSTLEAFLFPKRALFVYKNTVCTERLFSGKKPNWKYSYHVNTFAHKCISQFIPFTPKSDQQKYSFSLQHRPSHTSRSHCESRL